MWNSTKIHIFILKGFLRFSLLLVENGLSYLLLENIAESFNLNYKLITQMRIFSVNQKLCRQRCIWATTKTFHILKVMKVKLKVMCIGIAAELAHSSTVIKKIYPLKEPLKWGKYISWFI